MCLILVYAIMRLLAYKDTIGHVATKVKLMMVGGLLVGSTFFVKEVLGGVDCSPSKDGRYYLDIEQEVECDRNSDEKFKIVYQRASAGFTAWCCAMAVFACLFLGKSGKDNFAFLTEKMEERYYWWELPLLLRKLLIMVAGLLNTTTPSRGWFYSSLVIVLSLAAHSYARPFEDPWVDAAEFLSLWTTLFMFQGGMVWTMDPDGELAKVIEWGAIGLVTVTCLFALFVEVLVLRRRHDDAHHGRVKGAATTETSETSVVFRNPVASVDGEDIDDEER